jgi:hypothetical protein
MPVVAQMAEGAVFVEEGGGLHLAARNTVVHRRCATAVAECAAVGAPHRGGAQAPTPCALLDDLRVDAVAGATDSAFAAARRDAGVGASAAGAGRHPRPGVAGAADPALGPTLPKIGDGRAAACAAGPDRRVCGVVQDVGQPQQHRRAAGIPAGQRIRVGGHVPGQRLEEPRRASGPAPPPRAPPSRCLASRAGTAAVRCVIAELIAASIRAACAASRAAVEGAVTAPWACGSTCAAPPGPLRGAGPRCCGPRR